MTLAICKCRAAPNRLIIEPTCPFHGDDPFLADLADNDLKCLGCGTVFEPVDWTQPDCPDCGSEEYVG